MALTTLEERPEYRLAHVGSVLVVAWYQSPTVASLISLEKAHVDLAARYGKVTLLSLILSAASSPPDEVRDKIKEQTPTLQRLRIGSVVVVLTTGLASIFVRSYLAMLSLVAAEVMKVPKTIEAAAAEIQALPGQDTATKALTSLKEDLTAFATLPPTAAAA